MSNTPKTSAQVHASRLLLVAEPMPGADHQLVTPAQPMQGAQPMRVTARKGIRYKVVRETQAQSGQEQVLAEEVVATRQGDDLYLRYPGDAQVVLEGFYPQCEAGQCAAIVPAAAAAGMAITGASPTGVGSGSAGQLVYAYGQSSELKAVLQSLGMPISGAGFTETVSHLSYVPADHAAGLVPWLVPVGAILLAPSSPAVAAASPETTVLKGNVVAGPIIDGHGLQATAYRSDGTVLITQDVQDDGSFTLRIDGYNGAVLVRVYDSNAGGDYVDEATGQAKDLTSDLRAATFIPGVGTYNVSVNVLTELAVRTLGLSGGDGGQSTTSLATVTVTQINQANAQVASALGLTQDLVLGTAPVAVITTQATPNASANAYGKLLAALSGAEVGSSTDAVLAQLSQDLQDGSLSGTGLALLVEGASRNTTVQNLDTADLIKSISDLTRQASDTVINTVSTDNIVSVAERQEGVDLAGKSTPNATVTVTWGDTFKTAVANAEGDWSVRFSANEMPRSGATVITAQTGSATPANRSVFIESDTTAPLFSSASAEASIAENSGAAQWVYTAQASDANRVTYSLKVGNSDDALAFSINSTTGAVTLTENPDFESQSSYRFTVVATDAVGNASEQAVTLAVNNRDEVAPVITSVALTGATGAINSLVNAGDIVSATVTFSEVVNVNGTPGLTLMVGGSPVQATYVSGSGTRSLVFSHVMQSGYTDTDGISITSNSVTLGSASIRDNDGNDAVLSHAGVASDGAYLVDTNAAVLMGSTPAMGGTHAPGANLNFLFSEGVRKGSGNIRIVNENDNSVTVISVDSSAVRIDGDSVVLNPADDLAMNTRYHIEMDAGAIVDAAGNAFTELSNGNVLSFTVPDPAVSLNAIAVDNRVNATENASTINLSGTLSSNTPDLVARFSSSDFTITLTPANGDPVNAIVRSYNGSTGEWTATVAANALQHAQTYVVEVVASANGFRASAQGSVIVDTVSTAPVLSLSNDSGSSDSDRISSSGKFTVADLEAGGRWEYSQDNGQTWAPGSGTSATVTGDGEKTILVRQTDLAGNTSSNASLSFSLDTQVSQPTLTLDRDTGSNTSDGLTSSAVLNVGGLEAGASWAYSTNSGETWTAGTGTSFTLTAGRSYGSGTVQVRQTDTAGNVSSVTSNSQAFTIDTTAPEWVSGTTATAVEENSGAAQTVYTAQASDANTLSYSLKANNNDDASAFSINASTGAVTLTGNPDYETKPSYRFTVVVTDAAGNASEQAVTLGINDLQESGGADTTPPAAPMLTLQDAKITLPGNDRTTVQQAGSLTTSFGNAAPASIQDISLRLEGNGEDSGIYFAGLPLFHWILGAARGSDGTDDFLISQFLFFGYSTLGQADLPYRTIAVGSGDDRLNAFAELSAGGLPLTYLVGESDGADGSKDFSVAVWNGDAQVQALYTRFSQDGKLLIPIGNADDVAKGVLPLNDDYGDHQAALIFGTTTSDRGDLDWALVKVFADGSLDSTFGQAGKVVLPLSGANDSLNHAIALSDGSMLLLGTQDDPTGASRLVMLKMLANGQLDTRWGQQGMMTLQVGSLDTYGTMVTIDPQDRWVVTGHVVEGNQSDIVVWRMSSAGVLEAGFGDQGVLRIEMPGNQVPRLIGVNEDDSPFFGPRDTILVSALNVASDGSTGFAAISVASDGKSHQVFGQPFPLTNDQAGYNVFMADDGSTRESFGRLYQQGQSPVLLSPLLTVNNSNIEMESTGAVLTFSRSGGANAADRFGIKDGSNWVLASNGDVTVRDSSSNVVTVVGRWDPQAQDGTLTVTFNPFYPDESITAFVRQVVYRNTDSSLKGPTTVALDITLNDGNPSPSVVTRTVDVQVVVPGAKVVEVTGLETGATWEYSLDSGQSWTLGTGAQVALGDADPTTLKVRQTDAEGNVSAVATWQPPGDSTPPTIAVSSSAATLAAGQTATISFTLSESSADFSQSDVTVVGGTLSDFSGSGTTYTATFTPSANSSLTASISVGNAAFTDASGNANQDGNQSNNAVSIAVNTLPAPSVSALTVTGIGGENGYLNAGDTVNVAVTFSGPVYKSSSGLLPALALNIGGQTVNAQYYDGSGSSTLNFRYTIAAGQSDADGISIAASALTPPSAPTFNAATLKDASGRDAVLTHAAVPAVTDLKVDTTLPTIAITSSNTRLGFGETATVTFTLSEDSTSFTVADVLVTGGALSDFSGSGRTYTATFTRALSGSTPAKVSVPSGVFADAAINLNADGSDGNNNLALSVVATLELSAVRTGDGGFVINGESPDGRSGSSIANAGDVNGDGLADFIIGAPGSASGTSQMAGLSYVVFGKTSATSIDLSAVAAGSGGFVIKGMNASERSGTSVSGAGDFNGDGLADLIVGAYDASPMETTSAGRTYVVFGRSDTAAVDLAATTAASGVLIINGSERNQKSGIYVSAAGDVNADGMADLILSNMGVPSVTSHVIYGRREGGTVQLAEITAGRGGFTLQGQTTSFRSGSSVSSAGDVNGDGFADLIVGDPNMTTQAGENTGRSYVVFGGALTANVALSAVAAGVGGFVINGQCAQDNSGGSVSYAGDVNGDGLADVIVGARESDPLSGSSAGRSYVVFGKVNSTAVDLSAVALGSGGFVINGQCSPDLSGWSVSGAGDVNGDGFTDLIVGAPFANKSSNGDLLFRAGASYVVYGKSDGVAIDLSAVAAGNGGFVIWGERGNDNSGVSVSAGGDINGDGLADLLVGSPYASTQAAVAGRSYVIFGTTGGAFSASKVDWVGTSSNDVYADNGQVKTLVGGAGHDSLTASAASLLYGGSGNDRFSIGQAMAVALMNPLGSGGNSDRLARVDGGSGIDTLALSTDGLTLDLSTIAKQSAGQPEGGSRIDSIEVIDIAGTGANTLWLSAADVRDMAGMNLFNSGNGWADLPASVNRHQLRVDGGADDLIKLVGNWQQAGTASWGDQTYKVFNSADGSSQVLLATQVSIIDTTPPTISITSQKTSLGFGETARLSFTLSEGSSDFTVDDVTVTGGTLRNFSGSGTSYTADFVPSAMQSANASVQVGSGVFKDAAGNANADGDDPDNKHTWSVNNLLPVVQLSAVAAGSGGYAINGVSANWGLGGGVSSAGDVNGDGLDDLLVSDLGSASAQTSYVVFGSVEPITSLSNLGAQSKGFAIKGEGFDASTVKAVSSVGDVNGDGLDDVLVGFPFFDEKPGLFTTDNHGRSYVIFGKTSGADVSLSAVAAGTGGFALKGDEGDSFSGSSFAVLGDVNGDGLADFAVGAPQVNVNGTDSGMTYVVYGKANGTSINLSAIAAGSGGFVISGQAAGDFSGTSIANVGDVNGDGLADLLIGAPTADGNSLSNSGRSYLVFGQSAPAAVQLSAVAAGSGGFVVNGQSASDLSGTSVAALGDINGDGLADFAIGAPDADPNGTSSGRTYVVFGKAGGTAVNLSAIAAGLGGFVINGEKTNDQSGTSVVGAGDLNADGLADLIIGAPGVDIATTSSAEGRAYVVFGRTGTTAVELTNIGAGKGGFAINGQTGGDALGSSLNVAGDLDGDGLTDIVFGVAKQDTSATNAGRVYVIDGAHPNILAAGNINPLQSADAGSNTLSDGGQSSSLVSGAGADTITANAASVVYAGQGSDRITVGAGMLTALQNPMGSGGNIERLARVDGGEGIDTLALSGSGMHLNLVRTPLLGDQPRIDNIEVLDLTGTGNNTFSATVQGVAAMGVADVFSWGQAVDLNTRQLRVEGDAGDLINLSTGWTQGSNATYDNKTYAIYNANNGQAQLLVNSAVTVSPDLAPSVSSLTLTGSTGARDGGWLVPEASVTATVTFSEAVELRATAQQVPTLALQIGDSTVQARYVAGSGSNTLTFIAMVAAGQLDTDGIAIAANALSLGGATLVDSTNNNAVLTHDAVAANAAYKVDALALTPNATLVDGVLVAPTNLEEGASVEYRIAMGSGAFSAWSSAFSQPATDGTADGRYRVEVRQTDALGNVSAVQALMLDVGSFYLPLALSEVATGLGGFVLNGQSAGDYSGVSVSSAGDVNGDGLEDLIVGANYAEVQANYPDIGRAYVVWGRTETVPIDLSQVAAGVGGFVINGPAVGSAYAGQSVSRAGDVNGDGFDDLLVGAPGTDYADYNEGATYIVFGRSTTDPVNLISSANLNGFPILGEVDGDVSGTSVAAVGDVNGDGLSDLIIGAPGYGPTDTGRSYVVFGRTGFSQIDLFRVAGGSGGFVINPESGSEGDEFGESVSGAGDVNGDGLADLIIGARYAGPVGAGRAYVVFGKTGGAVNMSDVVAGSGGFVLEGQCMSDNFGVSASGAGDVNGDGLADLIVGADFAGRVNTEDEGLSYVVFGKSTGGLVEMSTLAAGAGGGFLIRGQSLYDSSGGSVSGVGDVNGDGLADLLVGAYSADPTSTSRSAGRSYVVFGRTGHSNVELSAVAEGAGGFVINGESRNDLSGMSVSGAGDVNGDGLADLIVGAWGSDPSGLVDAGRTYVIFGSTSGAFKDTQVDWLGTDGADTRSDGGVAKTLVAGAGDDVLSATAASVLYGGAGNDSFSIDQTMITALQSPMGSGGNVSQLARIDGGTGVDTLRLSGAGLTFDLTQVANPAASNPDGGSRIDSVEVIDLTGTGDNTLGLKLNDVLDLGSANLFQTTGRQQLMVKGNAGDQLDLADGSGSTGWTQAAAVTVSGVSYAVWNHNTSLATLYVDTAVLVG